jgi:hypothetical protein
LQRTSWRDREDQLLIGAGKRLADGRDMARCRFVGLCLLAGAIVTLAPGARADEPGGMRLALDLDYALAFDQSEIDSGGGGALRLGHEFDAIALSLTPEISGSYHSFSGDFGPAVYRGTGGLRLNVGKILEPGVYGHAGVGRASFDVPGAAQDPSRTAFTWDAGVTLDFTLLPVIEIGAHAAYNSLAAGDAERLDWLTAGLHATLAL